MYIYIRTHNIYIYWGGGAVKSNHTDIVRHILLLFIM